MSQLRIMLQNESGFTLVEVLFVAVIFPLVFVAVFSVMDMANVIFNMNGAYARVSHNAMQTLRTISREVGQSNPLASANRLVITTDQNDNETVAFQIPVDWDNDGDVVTNDVAPETEWGAYSQVGQTTNGLLDSWARYSVVGEQLIREVLDSAQTAVAGSERVIANNVTSFQISQVGDSLVMTITLDVPDEIGQEGSERVLSSTFTSRTLLRNAVS